MGRYTIHQVATSALAPLSRTAARKLALPAGSFAAYHPDLLLNPGFNLPPRWLVTAKTAAKTLDNFERSYGRAADKLDWVLQRCESVGSSTIEDVTPSLRRVARAEVVVRDGSNPYDATALEAIGNVKATRLALEIGDRQGPVTLANICAIHTALMQSTPTPSLSGRLRTSWVRIGGVLGGYPPPAYVAPPADEVEPLLQDLLAYVNTTSHPPIVAAAVAHAQFESIHPFPDGNGRTGRALIQTVLRKKQATRLWTPPISAILALSQDAYIRALTNSRYEGPPGTAQAQALDEWVVLFAAITEASCDHAKGLMTQVREISASWEQKLKVRSGSAAERILSKLPETPVFTVQLMTETAELPLSSTYRVVSTLTAEGIITPVKGKYKGRGLYEVPAILDLFSPEHS